MTYTHIARIRTIYTLEEYIITQKTGQEQDIEPIESKKKHVLTRRLKRNYPDCLVTLNCDILYLFF